MTLHSLDDTFGRTKLLQNPPTDFNMCALYFMVDCLSDVMNKCPCFGGVDVRAEFFGSEINVIAGEGDEIGTDMTRVAFDAERVNVYADDWRVKPEVAA